MVKHNNVIPNEHFRKHWQNYVKTRFNQPARKTRRRLARQKKAVKITDEMKAFKAYYKLRLERTNKRHLGAQLKRAAEAEKEDSKKRRSNGNATSQSHSCVNQISLQ
ncbi:60S ribosomal protein L13-1-like [Lathyrus oleraceus]|uniref:60S ribosomal protein L13-1-like n=1 Tax=Pisum sativum TaxID=3888 RepID=UPI0021D1AECB|nr:60S ribosomal protein L13-1-like [Pisum sativum]